MGTTTLQSQAFNVGGDISITPKQNIGILFHGFINPIGIDKQNTTYLKNNGTLDSSILTNSFIKRDIDNLNYNINYRGVFGKYEHHIITADADYSEYDRSSLENLQNDFYDAAGIEYHDPSYFRINSPAHINVRSAKIDYQRLIKKNVFEAGVKISKVKSINKIDFERMQNGNYTPIDTLTDHFTYNEQITAAYANYIANWGKTSLIVGLRVEETKANRLSLNPNRVADTSYFNFFPNIQVTHDVGEEHQFILNYNRSISRPTYQDLNPFVGYIDQYAYSRGNPFLRPQYTSTFQFSDVYRIKFKATLGLNVTKYFSAMVFKQDDETGVYTTIRENIGTRYQYALDILAPFDITRWWQITNDIAATYERYVYTIPGAKNRSVYDLLVKSNQNFSLTRKLKADVNLSYETPTYYGIKSYREQFFMDAGVSYTILHDQGSIKLAVTDIFNTQTDRYNTRFLNLDLRGREKQGTRFVVATFAYRFGNNVLRNARKRTGGITDEQTRLGGSTSEN
ncbi:MAG: TonB-dependent receptor [Sphingobacteriaceae bacterium]|nr:MAG: TonB-dependent receptor [Sphingobacteriaceae bacterium]